MTDGEQGRQSSKRRLWLAAAVVAAVLAVLIVPPLVSISRYKSSITQLMSASLGRPVRLSNVELRLLPRPGFVLNDLTVEEDPAYGAEPVLHANTVTASIRLFSLWRGRLEISRVSVDEASLNLVRTQAGRWNLDALFRTAAGQSQTGTGGPARKPFALPYLEATNSRINFKNGAEKLPFSLVNTDLSLSQEEPGNWRIQLRGQPARTDLSLDLADTGLLRLEATVHRAAQLRQMPVHLDLEWKEAQLGQLTRLVLGSDPGWRGDLTGEIHLDGTADEARVMTRLRASNVHRVEFAPAAPLDFDANCGFVYHYSKRAIQKLQCNSPLGNGHLRLEGELPGEDGAPRLAIELEHIPVQAALDALRTVRSGFGPGLEATGAASGKMTYVGHPREPQVSLNGRRRTHPGKSRLVEAGPLTGSFSVEGFALSGDGLSQPIRIAKLSLEPASTVADQPLALIASAPVAAGEPAPLVVSARLSPSGYQVSIHGQASLARARELAHMAGVADSATLEALRGEAATLDLEAQGPWVATEAGALPDLASTTLATRPAVPELEPETASDRLSGTLSLHNAEWKAGYFAGPVEIAQGTLHFGAGSTRWDPVVFSYGPLKGTATLEMPLACEAPPCIPHFQVQFGAVDASALQAAILGARKEGTAISTLLERLRPSAAPSWPPIEGTIRADSLILGPVTLKQPTAHLRIIEAGAEISGLDAGLLGGRVAATGSLHMPTAPRGTPAWTFDAHFQKLNPAAAGQLLGLGWSGGTLAGQGAVTLSGFTPGDLAGSAHGTLHFDWHNGSIAGSAGLANPVPAALVRFERWSGDAEIAGGTVTLHDSLAQRGSSRTAIEAAVTLGTPARLSFAAPKDPQSARR